MVHDILRKQPKIQNTDLTKLVLINSVTSYLLNINKTNFIAILSPLGSILNTFHIPISKNNLTPLKQTISKKNILHCLAKIILNESGYTNNLLELLTLLITYNANQ